MVSLRRALSLLTVVIFLIPNLASAQETEVLAITPIAAPDGNGTIVSFLYPPNAFPSPPPYGAVLNDAGQVVVTGYLTDTAGPMDFDDSGLFLIDEDRSLVQLARAGNPAPDGDGVFSYITYTRTPTLRNDGLVGFTALFDQNDSGELSEWGLLTFDETGQKDLLLREGDSSPDGQGTIDFINTPSLNQSGLAFFHGNIEPSGAGSGRALFRADVTSGEVTLLERSDVQIISEGGLNEAGQLLFRSTLGSDGDVGFFIIEPDDALTQVLRTGDSSPDSDEVFSQFRSARLPLNEQGQTALGSFLAPCVDCAATSSGIFLYDGGALVPIVRTGQAAPGGGTWFDFGKPSASAIRPVTPALNDQEQVAFYGLVNRGGVVFNGIYRVSPEGGVEVANNGQLTPSGNGFFQLSCGGNFLCTDVPHMNQRGQVVFFTNVRDAEGGVLENEGIFFYDDDLGLLEVVRENDLLLGSPIRDIQFTGETGAAKDNTNTGLNNLGQVAYAFELADGRSGVALWSPPESPVATDPEGGVPAVFAVEAAYPNPFREFATIRFALPTAEAVELAVYDVLGRRVIDRELGRVAAGMHRVDVSGASLAPGLYIAQLTTEKGAATTVRLVKAK